MTERRGSILLDDVPAAIGAAKAELRAQIGDVDAAYRRVLDHLTPLIDEVVALRDAGRPVWPELDYARIAAGDVTDAEREAIRRRGCLVVRGHFPRDEALAWDRRLEEYVDANDFGALYRGAGDDFFGTTTASKPSIYPIYWSPTQMEARQSPRMAAVQSFLNRLWTFEQDGRLLFDPDTDVLYPDRIRRRPPGTDNGGLGAHCDSGSLERWLLPGAAGRLGTWRGGQMVGQGRHLGRPRRGQPPTCRRQPADPGLRRSKRTTNDRVAHHVPRQAVGRQVLLRRAAL